MKYKNNKVENKSSLCKVEFLLPLYDNDGKPFKNHILCEVSNPILELAGGLSRDPSPIYGIYKDSKKRILIDINQRYMVALSQSKLQQLLDFLNCDVKRILGQESIYIEVKNDSEIRLI